MSEQLIDDETDQQLEQFDLEEVVQTNLAALPRREQRILTGLYGLGGAPTCTVDELSQQLGLTVDRVQQLERLIVTQWDLLWQGPARLCSRA